MAEYIDREEYCEKHCQCSNEYCDKESCPIWKAPAADVAPVVHGRWMKRRNGGTLCSRCGHYTQYKGQVLDMSEAIACPWCGAIMDGDSPVYAAPHPRGSSE